jgi:hypothetical protein
MTGQAWAYFILAMMVAFLAIFYWEKPKCRDGYIPIFVLVDGWSCTLGYKP